MLFGHKKGVYDAWPLAKHPADREQCVTCIHVQRVSDTKCSAQDLSLPVHWCHQDLSPGATTSGCSLLKPQPELGSGGNVRNPAGSLSQYWWLHCLLFHPHGTWSGAGHQAADTEGSGSFLPGTAGLFAGQFVLLLGFCSFFFPLRFFFFPPKEK